MNCGRGAGRCCGASGRRGWNCAPAIWNWTGWITARGAAGRKIDLTNKEFALLEHLLLNRGQCVSRVELLDSVWNLEPAQTTNIVDVYVNYLRRKIADPAPGQLIRTVRGRGYMVPLESELAAGADRLPRTAICGIECLREWRGWPRLSSRSILRDSLNTDL